MVDDSSQALGIAVRAALIIPAALAAAGVDLTKYRAWRERRAHWRREGRPPPPEYVRDNRLWQLRLTALIVGALSFISLKIGRASCRERVKSRIADGAAQRTRDSRL